MIASYAELKSLALSLNLPQVTDTTAWGNLCLKAHRKIWCWWSAYMDAAVFKCDKAERKILLATAPQTFALHPHYASHNLIPVRVGKIDPA